MKTRFALSFIISLLISPSLWAFPETMLILSPDKTTVALVGPISEAPEFLEAFLSLPSSVQYLHLESNGGRLDVALEFAREISRRKLTTFTKTNCQSACTFLYLAGEERWLHDQAYIVFHRIQYHDPNLSTQQKEVLQAYWQGRATQYYIDRGLSLQLSELIQSQASTVFFGKELNGSGYANVIQDFSLENFPSVFEFEKGTFVYPDGYENPK